MLGGITDAILLVALGLGYIVCYLANREEKTLKVAGYFIGVFIIVLSGAIILSNVVLNAKFCRRWGGKMGRIMMPQPATPAAPQK